MAIDIHIDDGSSVAVVKYNRNSENFVKYFTLNELQSVFKASGTIHTPFLPMGARKYYEKGNTVLLWIETPPHRRPIFSPSQLSGRIEVPLPILTFMIKLNRLDDSTYGYSNMRIFAQKKFTEERQEPLYVAPLLNVSTNGSICIGSIPMNPIENISKAYTYIDNFLGSVFTGGLGFHVTEGTGPKRFYQEISKQEHFPLDRLLSVEHDVQNYWQTLIGGIK